MTEPALKAHQIDYSQFIFFHPSATGENGRAVFIDPELIVRFMELIDISDKTGRDLAGKIIMKLSSIAGGITSDSNASNSGQHRDHFVQENIYVTYTILQNGGRGTGVYITNIELAIKGEGRSGPGLYKTEFSTVRSGADPWVSNDSSSDVMPTVLGVVGALKPDAEGKTSIDKTASYFGAFLMNQDIKRLKNAYSLFYTPSYIIDGYGVWVGSEQKSGKDRGSPQALANIILNTEKSWNTTEKHCWYVYEEGVKQFIAAMNICESSHKSFEHHEFKFISPKASLGELKNSLSKVGIELTQDMLIHDDPNTATKTRLLTDPSKTYVGFPRSFKASQKMNELEQTVLKHYSQRSLNVYFSDIVNNLIQALA